MLFVIMKERRATELKAIRREKRLKYDIEYEKLEKAQKQEEKQDKHTEEGNKELKQ